MPQHTQGEWKAVHNKVTANLSCMVLDSQNKVICEFPEPQYSVNKGERETLANARLIAAAPKLLEALEACVKEIKMIYANHGIEARASAIVGY